MSNTIQSESIAIGPADSRCRYWAKIIRAGVDLPIPSAVNGASDVPGAYLRNGDEELFIGDFFIHGEERHHRRNRGWRYVMTFIDPSDGRLRHVEALAERKAAAKAGGLPAHLLTGSGEIAGLIRLAHAVRLGISIDVEADRAE